MREFLARALPWPQEGEPPSWVNIHHVIKLVDKATGKPILRPNGKQAVAVPGRACRSVEEAARTIDWANTLSTDIYVCMSAQRTAEEKISKKGRKYYAAIRGQHNIARHKSIYVTSTSSPRIPSMATPPERKPSRSLFASATFSAFRCSHSLSVPGLVVFTRIGPLSSQLIMIGGLDSQEPCARPLSRADLEAIHNASLTACDCSERRARGTGNLPPPGLLPN